LLIAGEWTHRTTLTTFTLVPDRHRILAAKALASLLVSASALVVTVIVSLALVHAFGHAPGGAGTLPVTVVIQGWIHLAAWILIGLGFGAAFLSSVPAIVAYLLLPLVWAGVFTAIHPLHGASTWLNISSFNPMTLHALSAGEWAHAMATMVLWIGVPLVIGARRVTSGDIA
jgi:ABC-type transport system involved in multi-copper enzyme maturation permease subunit